jgi:hypothetical protein
MTSRIGPTLVLSFTNTLKRWLRFARCGLGRALWRLGIMNPDDWVEKCSLSECAKPVIVQAFAIIFSRQGIRWTFHSIGCFIKFMTEEGYFITDGEPS